MSSHGAMSGKKASNNPGLCPIKDNNLVFIVGLGPKISFQACLWVALHKSQELNFLHRCVAVAIISELYY